MPSWKKVIISGSDASLNSLNITTALTASGLLYPTTDGTTNQSIITDGAGNLSFGNPYSNNTVVYGKNLSGGTIEKGTPLYFTGSGTSGNLVGVYPADAANPSRMPAGGIAGDQILDQAEGVVLLDGFINGVDTSAFESGDLVWVAAGGGYTNVRPTGSSILIQPLGYVEKVDSTNGSGVIKGPGVERAMPNIQQGYTWVGDADGVAQPTSTASFDVNTAITASYALTASYIDAENGSFSGSFSGSFTGDGSNLTGVLKFTDTTVSDTFTNVESKIVTHNFGTKDVIVTVYNNLDQVIIPDTISNIDENNINISFASSTSGRVVVVKGGHLVSGSITAEFNTLTGNPFGYISGSSTISASGHLIPSANEIYDLGTSSYRWRDLYLSGSTIDLGGTLITRNADGDINFKDADTLALKTIVVDEIHMGSGVNRKKLKVENDKLKFTDRLDSDIITEVSASYALTSSYALTASYAENAGGGAGFPFSGSAVITGSLTVVDGIITGDGSGLTNVFPPNPAVSASFTNVTSLNYNHGFGTRNIVASIYNTSNQQIFPKQLTLTSEDVLDLTFESPQSGYLVVSSGGNIVEGTTQNALTASYSQNTISASYANLSDQSTNYNASSGSIKFWQGNQTEYDALGSYDNSTIYFVT